VCENCLLKCNIDKSRDFVSQNKYCTKPLRGSGASGAAFRVLRNVSDPDGPRLPKKRLAIGRLRLLRQETPIRAILRRDWLEFLSPLVRWPLTLLDDTAHVGDKDRIGGVKIVVQVE
jgi:hypothetical protein